MKRISNLYDKICTIDNLIKAEKKARKGKSHKYDVRKFLLNKDDLIENLHHILLNNNFKNSQYKIFYLQENDKIRKIYKLPYYPDRIVHHALLNILEPIFVKTFIRFTYSCIKYRGILLCLKDLNKQIKNYKYCLKLDIQKFYPSINNLILKQLLSKKFKDKRLLTLLFEIIDSNQGQPIGNYCSQYFANFYLSYFDHYCKEVLKIKYFRYCDDMVILSNNKSELRVILFKIKNYLNTNLKLELSNYQIFPINSRGINYLGYVSYHSHIRLRKRIKLKMIKTLNSKNKPSYYGWCKHANCKNLINKYFL